MKCVRTKPCGDCPFRKEAMRGWLGVWEAEDILNQAHSEVGLPCHSSYDNEKVTVAQALKTAHVCVGSLQNANNSFKLFVNPTLRKFAEMVGKNPAVMNAWEFLKHHTFSIQKENKRKA